MRLLLIDEKEIAWISFRLGYELQFRHATDDIFTLYIYFIYIFLDLNIFSIKITLKKMWVDRYPYEHPSDI